MKYMTTKEASILWKVSERMVRLYCEEGRIPMAEPDDEGWMIPEGTPKPPRKTVEKKEKPKPQLTSLAKQVIYQRRKNHHFSIYEHIQIYLAYSSNRMASNRLTRNLVEEIYRKNKLFSSFEAVKVDDIIETVNHFAAMRYVVDNLASPLTQTFIKKLHHTLTYGTYSDRRKKILPGEYRRSMKKFGVSPEAIGPSLAALLKDYERSPADMESILDFHVHFEMIRPFEDYNGRVGRLIMVKECLRHGIDPFIIDDKRRAAYVRGIIAWSDSHEPLMEVALEAQSRFQKRKEFFRLMQYATPPEKRKG